MGPSADQHAIMPRLGVTGRVNVQHVEVTLPDPLAGRVDADRGPNETRATEPLYGTGSDRPAIVT